MYVDNYKYVAHRLRSVSTLTLYHTCEQHVLCFTCTGIYLYLCVVCVHSCTCTRVVHAHLQLQQYLLHVWTCGTRYCDLLVVGPDALYIRTCATVVQLTTYNQQKVSIILIKI